MNGDGEVHDDGPAASTSPCLRVCKYNDRQQCFGCFRTTVEVRTWNSMSADDKAAVAADLERRRTEYWDQYSVDRSVRAS